LFKDINEVKSIFEIESMSWSEAQNYILRAKAQFSTLKLIKYWKSNNKYIYGKIYKNYHIPTAGHMIKVNKQNKWQEKNGIKLKEIIDKSKFESATDIESSLKLTPPTQIEPKSDSFEIKFDIMQYLNLNFKSEKIVNFVSDKEGIIFILGSGGKIKISPLSDVQIKFDIELSAVHTI